MNMKIGIYFTPDCMLPFLMVEVIMAEKKADKDNETIANILKSDLVIPVPENEIGIPAELAELPVLPRAEPRLPTTSIKTPANAKRRGPATTVAKTMNIT